ncbi:hypothetical protein [Mesorhizobium sp. L-8-10]|uniref:hypothetical protein n=1 Tax=Mesorhizobium sp. L-8-10 TaxID=2744523 RepID=UPI001927D88B|nr:hypothetical protein [Mesorhizobium sp. L-8-10]
MMVVGSMAGAGKFALPHPFGLAIGRFRSTIAWCIASGGFSMLKRVFRLPAREHRDIEPSVLSQLYSCLGNPTLGEPIDGH